jgi:hypothetical protein
MTLVEVHVELSRVADNLEKLVFLLEKLVFPPPPADLPVQQATLDDLHIVTQEDHVRMAQEQMAFAERYRVAPGSEAFAHALQLWEEEQRSIYGEAWEAPQDWRAIFAAAERSHRAYRDSGAPAAAETADHTRG